MASSRNGGWFAPEPGLPVWPTTLDAVLALPSVSASALATLPNTSGLYFALVDRQSIAYIGVAWSFRTRWERHEKLDKLWRPGTLSVAYLPCPYRPLLWQAELAAIWQFWPALNWQTEYRERYERQPLQLWPTQEWVDAHPGWVSSHSG